MDVGECIVFMLKPTNKELRGKGVGELASTPW